MFDRPEVEVPRGMEPTGTNGRTRHTLSDPLMGRVSSCGGFLVGWQGTLFLVVTTIGKAFIARVRCPVPGPPRPESWLVPLPADPGWGLAVHSGFAVVMAQVRRPVPFRTRKLRPGTAMVLHSRGCGRVARRRIQRWTFWSSPLGDSRKVPFVFPLGVPVGRNAPGTPFFYALLCRPADRIPLPGGRKAFPVPGRLGLFRASKGNFCCLEKTSGEQILFSERAFDTVYDTVF